MDFAKSAKQRHENAKAPLIVCYTGPHTNGDQPGGVGAAPIKRAGEGGSPASTVASKSPGQPAIGTARMSAQYIARERPIPRNHEGCPLASEVRWYHGLSRSVLSIEAGRFHLGRTEC